MLIQGTKTRYSYVLIMAIAAFVFTRRNDEHEVKISLRPETMGTA